MNVSISQLVEDFDTDVTTIQFVITFYALVMAALMITGGKLGDLWGRRRAFMIGHVIYAIGSLLTAISWSVPALLMGWSVIEGIGAAIVMPAIAALAAGTYQGQDRALAYGVLGGVSGVGIAVGPILGGWVTTYLTWRLVFAGEVVVAIITIIGTIFAIREPATDGSRAAARLGRLGAVRCWAQPDRLRRATGQHLGMAAATQLSYRAVRILAHAVCRGSGICRARRLQNVAAVPRRPPKGPSRPFPPVFHRSAAGWPQHAARPECRPDGNLLYDSALPSGRSGIQRASRPASECSPYRSRSSCQRSPAQRWRRDTPPG